MKTLFLIEVWTGEMWVSSGYGKPTKLQAKVKALELRKQGYPKTRIVEIKEHN